MGSRGNRSGQCFSACSFRCPLITSSASIPIPSSNISPKHSLNTQDTISRSSTKEIAANCSLNSNHDLLVEFSHRFVGVKNGQPSAQRANNGALILAAIKLTRFFANANPKASTPSHVTLRTTKLPKPSTLSYTKLATVVFSYTR